MVGRAQAYTLEGVLAAILVVTATVYGLGAIDTRAWEDETRAETQQLQYRASDVLALGSGNGSLKEAVLCYRPGRSITGSRSQPRSTFESILNVTFDRQADQYNLYFSYWDDDARETTLVSERTESSDKQPPTSAAAASTSVTLTDGMTPRIGDSCTPIRRPTIENDSSFYIPDASGSSLYNVVEVRLVVW